MRKHNKDAEKINKIGRIKMANFLKLEPDDLTKKAAQRHINSREDILYDGTTQIFLETNLKRSSGEAWVGFIIFSVITLSIHFGVFLVFIIIMIGACLYTKTFFEKAEFLFTNKLIFVRHDLTPINVKLYEFPPNSLRSIKLEKKSKKVGMTLKFDKFDDLYNESILVFEELDRESVVDLIRNLETLSQTGKIEPFELTGKAALEKPGNGGIWAGVLKFFGYVFFALVAFGIIAILRENGTMFVPANSCNVHTVKIEAMPFVINGEFDAGYQVTAVVGNEGPQTQLAIVAKLTSSEGDFHRKQTIPFDKNEFKTLTYQFHEPTINATNVNALVSCK
ncbi:MAG: hypothetical protein ACU841_15595 [Gammaproteobacteria bacterium]